MSGKPVIDRENTIELLKQGLSEGDIVRNHWHEICADPKRLDRPVSRQAISNIKTEAIAKGDLPESMRYEKPARKSNTKTRATVRKSNIEPSLDDIGEYLIKIRGEAAEASRLRNQLAATKNELVIARQELELLKKKDKEKKDKDLRWQLAKQQGDIGGA